MAPDACAEQLGLDYDDLVSWSADFGACPPCSPDDVEMMFWYALSEVARALGDFGRALGSFARFGAEEAAISAATAGMGQVFRLPSRYKTVQQFLRGSWYKSTFTTEGASIVYHWRRHVVDQGFNRTSAEYTQDALAFFTANRHRAAERVLRDGSPGLVIRTPGGGPGGYFTPGGRVVTFWYH